MEDKSLPYAKYRKVAGGGIGGEGRGGEEEVRCVKSKSKTRRGRRKIRRGREEDFFTPVPRSIGILDAGTSFVGDGGGGRGGLWGCGRGMYVYLSM